MEINPEIVVAVLGSGGVGFIGAKLWNAWSGSRRKDGAQNHSQYMELFEKQSERIAHLELENSKCRDDNAQMNREIGALREAVNRLETANVIAIVTADDQGKICGWSHGATVLFGWTESEAKGQDVEITIPERFRARHHAAFREALKRSENEPLAVIQLRDSWGLKRDSSEMPVTIHLRNWVYEGKRFFVAEVQKRT